MEQSVGPAQVYERAEVRHVLDHAFHHIALADPLEELLLHLGLPGGDELSAVADISSPLRIVLADDEFDFLSQIFAQIPLIGIGHKAGRDEHPDFLIDNAEAALQHLGHCGL